MLRTLVKWLAKTALLLIWIAGAGVPAALGQLPASKGAPQAGQKAPDFTLLDSQGKPVKLSELLAGGDATGRKGSWVLLVFYRGYW